MSNSRALQTRIEAAEEQLGSESVTDLTPAKQEVKVLGDTWNPHNDTLIFDLSELSLAANNLQPTKRNLVSLIGRFYDPFGFLAPVTVKYKVLFQKLCQSKVDWDCSCDLPEGLLKEWFSGFQDSGCSPPSPDHTQTGVTLSLPTFQTHYLSGGQSLYHSAHYTGVDFAGPFMVSSTVSLSVMTLSPSASISVSSLEFSGVSGITVIESSSSPNLT